MPEMCITDRSTPDARSAANKADKTKRAGPGENTRQQQPPTAKSKGNPQAKAPDPTKRSRRTREAKAKDA